MISGSLVFDRVGGVVAVYILKCTRGMRLGLERLGAVKLTFNL